MELKNETKIYLNDLREESESFYSSMHFFVDQLVIYQRIMSGKPKPFNYFDYDSLLFCTCLQGLSSSSWFQGFFSS